LVIATLALLAALTAQDTTGISPRARAMLDRFPPPGQGQVSITTRFSTDSAWLGEQVELVTAAWFPRELRDRLRRPPTLRAPSLGGLWSAQPQSTPILAGTRVVQGVVYDLFVAHQTLFPLSAGQTISPPAVLTYAVPTSVSFFAPEERQSLSSRPVSLAVRPIPPRAAAALGTGPTARGLRLTWRAPAEGLRAATPARVELVMSGEGNVTLWPEPTITWPAGLRVYPEPVQQQVGRPRGVVSGEKRFRFTVVPDSAGVVTLPSLRYPYFDPGSASVRVATTGALGMVVRESAARPDRALVPVTPQSPPALATRAVRDGWPLLLVLAVLPLLRRPRPRRMAPRVGPRALPPEASLRALLGTPADAAPERVAEALRHRGVSAEQATGIATWMARHQRARYGPVGREEIIPPPEVGQVLDRLRRAGRRGVVALLLLTAPLAGQAEDPIARYRGGDPVGAARGFREQIAQEPHAVAGWRNLAAARWVAGDDVGAVAAWIRALELAPRDPLTRLAWDAAEGVPAEVRGRAPVLPLSRDELILVALLGWMVAMVARRTGRTTMMRLSLLLAVIALMPAISRTLAERQRVGLVRPGAVLRVSPVATAPALAAAPTWTTAESERTEGGWMLVTLRSGARGWLPAAAVAPIGALD
jgi:hypothetical protein